MPSSKAKNKPNGKKEKHRIPRHFLFKNEQRLKSFRRVTRWLTLFIILACVPMITALTIAIGWPLLYLLVLIVTIGLVKLSNSSLTDFFISDKFRILLSIALISFIIIIILHLIKELISTKYVKSEQAELNETETSQEKAKYIAISNAFKKRTIANITASIFAFAGIGIILIAFTLKGEQSEILGKQISLVIFGLFLLIICSIARSAFLKKTYSEVKPFMKEIEEERKDIKIKRKEERKHPQPQSLNFGLMTDDTKDEKPQIPTPTKFVTPTPEPINFGLANDVAPNTNTSVQPPQIATSKSPSRPSPDETTPTLPSFNPTIID